MFKHIEGEGRMEVEQGEYLMAKATSDPEENWWGGDALEEGR